MNKSTETQVEGDEPRLTVRQKLLVAGSALAVPISIYQIFNLGTVFGFTALTNQYLYCLIAILLPLVFIQWPAFGQQKEKIPFYDIVLGLLAFGAAGYLAFVGKDIVMQGWEYDAPGFAVWISYLLWALVLEATRRAGGIAIFLIVLVISFYPIFAADLPAVLAAAPSTLQESAIFHAFSEESVLGIPMRAFGSLVIGFMVFGVVLQYTGGGSFFMNLAFALLGHVRGGPAKVAIFSSGLMGSMSGSVITNVLTTGVMTIPAMRKVGFSKEHSGGIEACASTGGVLMPPVMGATAFVMATFLEVAYIEIAIAALVPSVLYFFGLFMQIDAYAARMDLKGLPKVELPSVRQTLKEGWYFIAVFALLIWMLVFLSNESWAPYFATVLLVVINQLFSKDRWSRKAVHAVLEATGKLFAELTAILAGVGLIVGALVMTGKIGNIANDLLTLAGGNPLTLLAMGALTAFVLGIGMTVTAAYIFLAIALAPALIQNGMDPMAVHLFILYWGMLSYITPPVALGAFAAASLANAKAMSTGFQAMRLGSIIYFIPFFFVFDTGFLLQGDWGHVVTVIACAVVGVVLLAGSLQGYLIGIGDLGNGGISFVSRLALLVCGITLALPASDIVPIEKQTLLMMTLISGALAGALILLMRRNLTKNA